MKLILHYLGKHRGLLFLNVLSAFSFAIAELGIPTIFGNMVDQGVEPGNAAAVSAGFRLIVLAGLLTAVGTSLLAFVTSRLSTTVVYEIRRDLFNHVMTFSIPEMEKFGTASLITRTNSDAYQILIFLNTLLRSALISPIMLLVSIGLVLSTSVSLSWIILATIPLIVLGAAFVFKTAAPLSEKQQKSTDAINRILRENLSGIRVVRSFNRQKTEEERFAEENRRYEKVSEKLFKLMQMTDPVFFFLMNIASLMIYYFASVLISRGLLQVGQLMMFTEYLFHCMMSVLVLCMVFMMYPRADVSARRIQAVLDTEPSVRSEGILKAGPVESIEFDHVSFSYPGSGMHSLSDISFKAGKGQKIAVIGSTGSGKSTLIKLITRFYDPQQGRILINGRDIRDYDLQSVRNQMAVVSQKAHLFSGTIRDNITFGNPDALETKVQNAIKISQSESFIEEREKKLEDPVSEEGSNLSGGQKQRLSIARAIASNAGLYILDDSFSALDLQTDAKLRKALQPVQEDSLFVVVAQRITSILDADLILVLDQGRLEAAGTHQELYQSSPLYRQIVLSQMNEEEAEQYV